MTLGVVAFIVALLVSIMLHEAGHFVTAKRFGMKATQFFLGFGPTLWSFRRGETEYGVKAIPAGGFVKIVGMTTLEEVPAADAPRAFYRQPAGRRAVVLAAGSTMHFLIAVVLVVGAVFTVGVKDDAPVVTAPRPCVPTTPNKGCPAGAPPSPAAVAGFRAGDRILAVNGEPISSYEQFTRAVRAHGPGPVEVDVDRDGRRLTLRPDLVAVQRPALDDRNRIDTVGAIGLGPSPVVERTGPVASLREAGSLLGQMVTGTFSALVKIPSNLEALFRSPAEGGRDASGLVGPVGAANVSGQLLASDVVPWSWRVMYFALLIAGLNLFFGIFNLLPLLPLDGGHLAVLGYEQGRGKIARLRGRPDPGRVDITKLLPAAYLVIALFVGLSVLLISADILNPIRLNQ